MRAFLFMVLTALAAAGLGVSESYLCDNGILTTALPMSPARAGSLSTRSTHPSTLSDFNALADALGLRVSVVNPFVYRTKAELIDGLLRPVLRPEQIQATVSCWMAGRKSRPCGGCIPCLLRRFSMLAAGLGDEAYDIDLLNEPEAHRGSEAFDNLIDMLHQVSCIMAGDDGQLYARWPQLLELPMVGVRTSDVIAMYRRYAAEVCGVLDRHFPAAARLLDAGHKSGSELL